MWIGLLCNLQFNLVFFFNRLSDDDAGNALNALSHVYKMFTNDKDYPLSAVRGIAERVFLPLLRECSQAVLLEFFVSWVCDIMNTMEAKLARVKCLCCALLVWYFSFVCNLDQLYASSSYTSLSIFVHECSHLRFNY